MNYLVFQDTLVTEDFAEDVFAHVTVHGRQGVVKEIDIGICIHGTRQAHALPLTSAQVEALPQGQGQRLKAEYSVAFILVQNDTLQLKSTQTNKQTKTTTTTKNNNIKTKEGKTSSAHAY